MAEFCERGRLWKPSILAGFHAHVGGCIVEQLWRLDKALLRLADRFCKELFAMRRSIEPMQGKFLDYVLSRGGTCEAPGIGMSCR